MNETTRRPPGQVVPWAGRVAALRRKSCVKDDDESRSGECRLGLGTRYIPADVVCIGN